MEFEQNHIENFIEEIIVNDIQNGRIQEIKTRFPPEPNGYLHIGHAKSICLNFGLVDKFGGSTHLRFDDTNPSTEKEDYVQSIKKDIQWLGFQWEQEFYASDYFDTLFKLACHLIQEDLAYIDESSPEDIAISKGTPTSSGVASRYRNRPVAESIALFNDMKAGKIPEGAMVLRAKIDLNHPNMQMRDPIIYRIKFAHHHRTANQWCIYPMYDFAHGQSDAIETITHSICTLEFIPHRPVYDWFIEKLHLFPSKQYEFARLNLTYTIMSKRKLLFLVDNKYVNGWDDPRMPTISGLRNRGYTPASIRNFCHRIGIAKRDNIIEHSLLEFCVREDLNKIATRRMVVVHPLKLIITNFNDTVVWLDSSNNPEQPESGSRKLPFTKELWIEKDDFMENPPKKYFRLTPGQKVRLKSAFIIECTGYLKAEDGSIKEVYANYIPESQSGNDTSGINVKGTIHWVSIKHADAIELRLYNHLFTVADTSQIKDNMSHFINSRSLEIIPRAWAEPQLLNDKHVQHFQFIRHGYFFKNPEQPQNFYVFHKTVDLKDSWAPSKS
ncbi:MAG: glutamine--tRNA ligase/YqeY domain fusion protein [Alphaproteobacteria bacterium]|nr:glutamine--tRNA ligase/YqeY domain fusion protein [Alphaproteobacteria bacterium]